jgi:5-(carboxyamino)imidazole ribonucleotide synthase
MTMPALKPNATIGIVGGGQLGRMSAMAAARLGFRCHVFTPDADAPATQIATATIAAYEDAAALRRFAESVDVVTFEFENVSAAGLDLLASLRPVRPAPALLRISQDRIAEKSFLNLQGIATAPWTEIGSQETLHSAAAQLGLPAVLKTTRFGYDGKGQAVVRDTDELVAAWQALHPKPLIMERHVDFACECSVVVARSADGSISSFDTVENRHHHHILDLTLAPARLPVAILAETQRVARQVVEALGLEGLLAVEMFIDRDGGVLVNEIAPRPHNSGHWTLDACSASQFELHIRAVAGLPLPPAFRHSDAVMRNLVGPQDMALWPQILATPGLIPHLYGKSDPKAGRKMGHVTTLFPRDALPGEFGIAAALGCLARDRE